MLAHGGPCGLTNYWENKINIPTNLTNVSEIPDVSATVPTTASPTSTPLHSLTLTLLEYQLCKSITLSSILINLVDIPGTGINPKGKSHKAWALLKEQYGKPSERTRNMREWDLDECKYTEGTKVAGEGGHIKKMRTLRKLANDAGANYDDARFKTKLIDSFPESWDAICSICYNMKALLEVISTLTSHGKQVLWARNAISSPTDTVKALEASVLALQAEIKTL